MATQLKNTLSIVELTPGSTVTILHELDNGQIPVEPDIIFLPSPDLRILAVDELEIVVQNQGAVDFSGAILVEFWHTFERAFGDQADLVLPVKPYVVVGSEVAGESPIPPFPVPPAIKTIYARTTGSDTTGIGTLADPYRTFQRAIRDVPYNIPPGVSYRVDVTGIGTELLPDDFVLPSWKSAQFVTGYDFSDLYFYIQAAVQLRADPQLAAALAPVDQTIPAGVWNAVDPNTGLISFTRAAGVWAPGALVGLFAVGAGGVFEKAPIYDNDATTIWIPDTFGYTLPLSIMEPSAVLRCQSADPGGFSRCGIYAGFEDSLVFAGLGIEPVPASGSVSLGSVGGNPQFELCDVLSAELRGWSSFLETASCNFEATRFRQGDEIFFLTSRIANGCNFGGAADQGSLGGFANVIDGCDPLGRQSPSNLFFFNLLIINAASDGVQHVGNGGLFDTEISDSVGDAVQASGPTRLDLSHVTGTGNGGVGIHVLDGAMVSADADAAAGPTTVTGSNDQKVGDLAAGAYPAAPFNKYDITAVGAGGATGTGARLFTP